MIAIHKREGSFSDRWIQYCEDKQLKYKIVNCYSSDIVDELDENDILLWHWHHSILADNLIAPHLLTGLEKKGVVVFPNHKTCCHFDNKLSQKFFFEALGLNSINTYSFVSKKEALLWAEDKHTIYPKVFKLKGGAGAENVRIVRNVSQASTLIKKAFGKGFKVKSRSHYFIERLNRFLKKKNLSNTIELLKGVARFFIVLGVDKDFPREKGYVYFQDFISNNDSDIRVIVIGRKAFAIKRLVREGDFRASGSGQVLYAKDEIPMITISESFKNAKKLDMQCAAFDYVFESGKPLLVEVSYGFSHRAYRDCPGYWDENLNWVEGIFYPQDMMLELLLKDNS